jgi:hypothetical protein
MIAVLSAMLNSAGVLVKLAPRWVILFLTKQTKAPFPFHDF